MLPLEVTIFNTFVCRDTWLEGRGFQSGIAKWRHCMTWSPLLLRWFELLKKKREMTWARFAIPVSHIFWSWIHLLEPVHGLSDKTVGSEIQQTLSEVTQKWTALLHLAMASSAWTSPKTANKKHKGISIPQPLVRAHLSRGCFTLHSVTRGGSTHASWLPKHKGKP